MDKIEEILAFQTRYLQCYGRPTEEDHSLNDSNRDLILAMADHFGHVFVGTFNGEISLAKYDGRKIYNAAYDFCVPDYDGRLDSLLHEWKTTGKVRQLDAIQARIGDLDGHLMLWV